jgi:hypothetical protein
MNIDRRIKYMIVLDTETCPLDKDTNEVNPWNMWTYDCGWAVVDKKGRVYKTASYINANIFLDEKELMQSAYYANKIPSYWKDIKEGKRTLTSFYNIRKALLDDIALYGVTEVYAHNMRFDYGTLTNTQRWLTKSKYRSFFPYNVRICDTLKMSRDILSNMPSYKRFCESNGYVTKRGNIQYTAEVIYRFITRDTDFIESHTALEDVMIEKEILAYCYKQHKKMRKDCFSSATA